MNEVRCPSCEQNFQADLAQCPHCGAASLWKSSRPRPQVIEQTEMALAGDRVGGERLAAKLAAAVPPRPKGDWSTVKQGLQIASWGLILGVILSVASLFAQFLPAMEAAVASAVNRVLRIGSLVALGLVLQGIFFFCGPPAESGLRMLGRATRAFVVLAVALALFAVVLAVSRARDDAVSMLLMLSLGGAGALGLAASLLSFLMLRGVARAFYQDGLGLHFILYFLASLVIYGGYVAFSMFLLASVRHDEDPRGAEVIVGCSGALFSGLLQAWLLGLFARLHEKMGPAS